MANATVLFQLERFTHAVGDADYQFEEGKCRELRDGIYQIELGREEREGNAGKRMFAAMGGCGVGAGMAAWFIPHRIVKGTTCVALCALAGGLYWVGKEWWMGEEESVVLRALDVCKKIAEGKVTVAEDEGGQVTHVLERMVGLCGKVLKWHGDNKEGGVLQDPFGLQIAGLQAKAEKALEKVRK